MRSRAIPAKLCLRTCMKRVLGRELGFTDLTVCRFNLITSHAYELSPPGKARTEFENAVGARDEAWRHWVRKQVGQPCKRRWSADKAGQSQRTEDHGQEGVSFARHLPGQPAAAAAAAGRGINCRDGAVAEHRRTRGDQDGDGDPHSIEAAQADVARLAAHRRRVRDWQRPAKEVLAEQLEMAN